MYRVFTVVGFMLVLSLNLSSNLCSNLSSIAFADQQVIQQVLTVKERVRLSLWYQGVSLNQTKLEQNHREQRNGIHNNNKKIPVELETVLSNTDF